MLPGHILRGVGALLLAVCAMPALADIPASQRSALIALYNSANGDGWTQNANWKAVQAPQDCTQQQSFWVGAPGGWPAAVAAGGMTLGMVSYTQAELEQVLAVPPGATGDSLKDNLVALAQALIVAKLNIEQGADDTVVATSVTESDTLMGLLNPLSGDPLGDDAAEADAIVLTLALHDFNEGIQGPGLCPAPVVSTADGFNAPGGECAWFGVSCDAGGNNVTAISLDGNNLIGTLPALSALPALTLFHVQNNQLSGNIPSLSGMAALSDFVVSHNQLSGNLPTLSGVGLDNLQYFGTRENQLSGAIPSLAGLTKLATFNVSSNKLTGVLPSLEGLDNLEAFYVFDNQLTGSPAAAPPANVDRAQLCPNALTPAANAAINTAWDAAVANSDFDNTTPWSSTCVAPMAGGNNTAASVPTLGESAMALLGLLLAGLGAVMARRRKA